MKKSPISFLLTASFETLIQSTLVFLFVIGVGYHLQLRAGGDKSLKAYEEETHKANIRYVLPDSSEIATTTNPFSF